MNLTSTQPISHHIADFGKTVYSGFGSFFSNLAALANSAANARQCAREIERLMILSDEELSKRGLVREEIVEQTFRKYMHS